MLNFVTFYNLGQSLENLTKMIYNYKQHNTRRFIMSRKSDKKGFTLAEMLIALAVIGVIAAITMPLLHKIIPTKEDTTKKKADYLVQ